jgi:hypothetical protein
MAETTKAEIVQEDKLKTLQENQRQARETANDALLTLMEETLKLAKELQQEGRCQEAQSNYAYCREVMNLGWVDGPKRKLIMIDLYLGPVEVYLMQGNYDEVNRLAHSGLNYLSMPKHKDSHICQVAKAKLYAYLGQSYSKLADINYPSYKEDAYDSYSLAVDILKKVEPDNALLPEFEAALASVA